MGTEKEGKDRETTRYLKWVVGVKRYMMREELQREKLRGRAGIRAWSYERNLEDGRRRECWEEIRNLKE